jgi:predicted nucleic acid-binding protein
LRLALDSNILVYAEGVNGEVMQQRALQLLSYLDPADTVLPAQTLGELFHVLVRKARWERTAARSAILSWQDTYLVTGTSSGVISSATGLACDHGIAIWDAVVMASAADAGCRLLLSEDMHDGFTWNGITVTNPFASTRHALLEPLLTRPAV